MPPARRGSSARLETLTQEDLAAVIPTPAFGDTPRGIFLATVLFHQACHAGQLATARRMAGHPGAIQIPGMEWGEAGGSMGEGVGVGITFPGERTLGVTQAQKRTGAPSRDAEGCV